MGVTYEKFPLRLKILLLLLSDISYQLCVNFQPIKLFHDMIWFSLFSFRTSLYDSTNKRQWSSSMLKELHWNEMRLNIVVPLLCMLPEQSLEMQWKLRQNVLSKNSLLNY